MVPNIDNSQAYNYHAYKKNMLSSDSSVDTHLHITYTNLLHWQQVALYCSPLPLLPQTHSKAHIILLHLHIQAHHDTHYPPPHLRDVATYMYIHTHTCIFQISSFPLGTRKGILVLLRGGTMISTDPGRDFNSAYNCCQYPHHIHTNTSVNTPSPIYIKITTHISITNAHTQRQDAHVIRT